MATSAQPNSTSTSGGEPAATEAATPAATGTPQYGSFGKANETEPPVPAPTAGSSPSPDERTGRGEPRNATADTAYEGLRDNEDTDPATQRGHVAQNQAPAEVRAARHADADVQRGAWADDDARYAGGQAEASWQKNNDEEHSND